MVGVVEQMMKVDCRVPKLRLLSVIIPTYNRSEELERCLLSLAGLVADRDQFEVIIVDDGSQISSEKMVRRVLAGCNFMLLSQQNCGPARARNYGAECAMGQYLAFLDDDCTVPEDWFSQLAGIINDDAMIGGHTINLLSHDFFPSASQCLIDYLYGYFNGNPGQTKFITSNNMIVPTEKFIVLGGFSSVFPLAAAEDRDLCWRWLAAGYQLVVNPQIIVFHRHAMNFCRFFRQHFGYGLGASIFHRQRRKNNDGQIRIEPLRFYFQLLAFPLRERWTISNCLLSMCLLLSQFATATGYFLGRLRPAFRRCGDSAGMLSMQSRGSENSHHQ
jgi:glycosyltransferase involved in cell wall biosynthesis